MDWKYLLTSFDGRINRAKFWAGIGVFIVIGIIAFILDSILGTRINHGQRRPDGHHRLSSSRWHRSISLFALYAKRWHDRDKSGWWTLIVPGACHRRHLASGRTRHSRRNQWRQSIRTGPACLTDRISSGFSSAFRAASTARPIFSACPALTIVRPFRSISFTLVPEGTTESDDVVVDLLRRLHGLAVVASRAGVKRLHDLDKPGIVALIAVRAGRLDRRFRCVMPVSRANPGPNRYGSARPIAAWPESADR